MDAASPIDQTQKTDPEAAILGGRRMTTSGAIGVDVEALSS